MLLGDHLPVRRWFGHCHSEHLRILVPKEIVLSRLVREESGSHDGPESGVQPPGTEEPVVPPEAHDHEVGRKRCERDRVHNQPASAFIVTLGSRRDCRGLDSLSEKHREDFFHPRGRGQ